MYIKLQRRKTCNVCKRCRCNGHREHLEILSEYGRNSLIMEETFPDKRILEKLEGEWKGLVFYIATKLKP
jgi:hypothetical protein